MHNFPKKKLAEIIPHFDVILDCTDNVDIRNAVDRGCEKAKIPLISGAAIRLEGQVSVFTYEPNTPTYRQLSQLFGQNVLSCVEAGVLAPIVGVVGSIQALEAIKVRLKIGKNLCGRLLMIDGFSMNIREIKTSNQCGIKTLKKRKNLTALFINYNLYDKTL